MSRTDDLAKPRSRNKQPGLRAPEPDSVEAPLSHLEHLVLSPIKKRFYTPLNHLLDRLTYTRAAALLVLLTAFTAVGTHFWKNPGDVRRLMTVARFGWAARNPVTAPEADVADVKRDLLNFLKDEISPAKRDSGTEGSYGPWTQAQMIMSLQGQSRVQPSEISQWFTTQQIACTCWREYKTSPQNLAVTSWVLLAFARMNVKPDPREIQFVLHNQKGAGWWPVFPATDDASNASTYATSLSVWALDELLRRDLIPVQQAKEVQNAVANGREWILDNSIPGKPGRWKDYPGPGLYHEESLGVSGLALHVLHSTTGPAPTAADLYWMANLPNELPPTLENSSSNHIVTTAEGPVADPTHNFSLPWLLIGTADAYSRGTWSQRSHALRLFHQIPDRRESISRESMGKPWFAAETLLSLRHLLHEDVI
jgi:hypothetical protein